MSARLILGTAQFGLPYGVTNSAGIPDNAKLSTIFTRAKALGITLLDTAVAYGKAQERIGQLANNQFQLITKIPQGLDIDELQDCVNSAMITTRSTHFYGVLFHSQDDLLNYDFDARLSQLVAIKQQGLMTHIGVSIYDLDAVLPLLKNPDITLIQIPLNVLDNRASKAIYWLKKHRPELRIHIRSAFLQGALLSNPTGLPAQLTILQNEVETYLEFCEHQQVNPGVAALNFVLQHPVDGVVVGVTTEKELQQVSQWFQQAATLKLNIPKRPFHEQFDPRCW